MSEEEKLEDPPSQKMTSKRKTSRKSKAVLAIPKGFHTVTPYLVVSSGSEAIEFYKKAFGAKEMLRHSTPDGKVLNAQLKIGDSMLMLSDEFPGSDTKSPLTLGTSTVTLHIYAKDVDKLWEQATSVGAKIIMPLSNQFWGERYGQLVDPFGHRWSLAQVVKMSKEEMQALEKASMEMMHVAEEAPAETTAPAGVG
jgi:PhnB protein